MIQADPKPRDREAGPALAAHFARSTLGGPQVKFGPRAALPDVSALRSVGTASEVDEQERRVACFRARFAQSF